MHLIGYLFLAVLVVQYLPAAQGAVAAGRARASRALAVVTAAALIGGLVWQAEHPLVHPDHTAAMAYVREHRQAGQPMIVALPPVAWLSVEEAERGDLYFLAGPQDHKRARGYTRRDERGHLIDYWVGASAIDSSAMLESLLRAHPDAWVIVDDERLEAEWAYGGEMERIIRDSTRTVYEAPGGAKVLRPVKSAEVSPDHWDDRERSFAWPDVSPGRRSPSCAPYVA